MQQVSQIGPKSHRKGHSGRFVGAPGQVAENGYQSKICSKWPELNRNPVERPFWRDPGAPSQDAENGHQSQICSKWAKLGALTGPRPTGGVNFYTYIGSTLFKWQLLKLYIYWVHRGGIMYPTLEMAKTKPSQVKSSQYKQKNRAYWPTAV